MAALLGVALAVPFLYLVFLEWLALVRLGGWFAYAIVAWGVACVGWLLFVPLGRLIERWQMRRLAREVAVRDSAAVSEANRRSSDT